MCMSSVSVCVCKRPKVTHDLLHHNGRVCVVSVYVCPTCVCVSVCRHPKFNSGFLHHNVWGGGAFSFM